MKNIWQEVIGVKTVFYILRFYSFIFREKEGREKERERNMSVREKHVSVASYTSPDGTWPVIQAWALTGD